MQRPLALITGTSSGFGLSASIALARQGFQVAATMRNMDKRDALLNASESLRLEMLPFGVRVVLIEPGAFKTDIWDKGLGALNLNPQSPYASLMKSLDRQVAKIVRSAGDPLEVIEVILEAAKSPTPKLRYRSRAVQRKLQKESRSSNARSLQQN